MNRWSLIALLFCLLAFAYRSPAPFIYTPGEGIHYEKPGETAEWHRARAEDQLKVAQEAFDKGDIGLAEKAANRTLRNWPYSDYAPQAQYLLARTLEAKGKDEKAFKSYQKLIEQYPKHEDYEDIVRRQFDIANRYLAGKWFRLWGVIPLYPSMDKTIKMYDQIIKNGPYSQVAPQAQLNIGKAHEKRFAATSDRYSEAAKAYETAADRYRNQPAGIDGMFRAGLAYSKESATAEYDQSVSAQTIATMTDFMTLYPDDPRVPRAEKIIDAIKTDQARGSYDIARFYEKKHAWKGALIYYNEVLIKDPDSKYADLARRRIDVIKQKDLE